jgi:glycosyltransferase involved in cell wall biosynthesis
MAAKVAKRYNKPFVLTQHNTFIEYQGIWNTVENLNDITVGSQVLKSANKIVVVSKATMNYVLSLGASPEKTVIIHNGVDLSRFKPMNEMKDAMRKKLAIPDDAIVAVTVRRLVYKNGIDTLIESAKLAIRKNPQLFFIADRDLPSYYNVADFFILPSKSGEGLPLVALEAMACGLPVVATNVGGIREIMIEGFGKIVPPNNPDLLAEAIFNMSKSTLTFRKNELRKKIEERYSWDQNVRKLLEIYEELI